MGPWGQRRLGRASGSLVEAGYDLEFITAFVDRAAGSGGALLLSGEAGVGKTVLLDAAAAYAGQAGRRVLRAAGTEFEGTVSFAGLNQLLLCLPRGIEQGHPAVQVLRPGSRPEPMRACPFAHGPQSL